MKTENVINEYFSENNGVIKRTTLKSKIINRLIAFIICSIVYPLITLFKRHNSINGDEVRATSTVKYIDFIMIICYIVAIIGFIWIMIDIIAPKYSAKLNDKLTLKLKESIFNILDWGLILPICATLAVFCYSFLFIITPISGYSMTPNIKDGESVFVSYVDKINQFDVVVMKVTKEDNFVEKDDYYIKRIIGMPGQTVTWENKVLKINGEIIEESFFPEDYLENINNYTEFHGEFKYKKDGNEFYTMTIPEGFYFVMGDNRDNNYKGGSKDSRIIGLIPQDNIIGVAKYHIKGIIPWGKIR